VTLDHQEEMGLKEQVVQTVRMDLTERLDYQDLLETEENLGKMG